jgi:hypothetical protein
VVITGYYWSFLSERFPPMPEFVSLQDVQSPWRIEYSSEAMERIRERALDGLMALPRVGIGIGGILLGEFDSGVVRITGSVELPCSHTIGPMFSLTPEEIQQGRRLAAGAGTVVGWYCSKTRGEVVLNESDLTFYNALFPEPGRLALVLRPSAVAPLRAAFFFRDGSGRVVKGAECQVDEWSPLPLESEPAPAPVEPVAVPANPVEKKPVPSVTLLADIAGPVTPLGSVTPRPQIVQQPQPPGLFGVPGLQPPRPHRGRNKFLTVLSAAAAIAVAAAAYVTQDSWLPRPPLTLSSTPLDGNLVIRWNPEALRGIRNASMYVNDGGTLHTVTLDQFQLNSGVLSYTPKSERVTAKLEAGETNAVATWFAPVPAPPPGKTAAPAVSQKSSPTNH